MKNSSGFILRQLAAVMAICGLVQFVYAQDAAAPAPADEEFFDFDEGAEPELRIADPLEPLNRVTFAVNQIPLATLSDQNRFVVDV